MVHIANLRYITFRHGATGPNVLAGTWGAGTVHDRGSGSPNELQGSYSNV